MTKEEIKRNGYEFSVRYADGKKDMTLYLYDKNGKIRAKQHLDEEMLVGLLKSIVRCLGIEE